MSVLPVARLVLVCRTPVMTLVCVSDCRQAPARKDCLPVALAVFVAAGRYPSGMEQRPCVSPACSMSGVGLSSTCDDVGLCVELSSGPSKDWSSVVLAACVAAGRYSDSME